MEETIQTITKSLDLLKTTKETVERTRITEYDAYKEKLQQSQTINKQHTDDLNQMWIELEKYTITNTDAFEEIERIINQIEISLTKKHIQVCFQPNTVPFSLGSLDESLSSSDLCTQDLGMQTQIEIVESINPNLKNLNLVFMEQEQLPENEACQQADSASKSLTLIKTNISTEPITTIAATTMLNFSRLKSGARKSVSIREGQRMASNDEYVLVCPKNRLKLLDTQGIERLNIIRDFEVSDICWSNYLKQFLILSNNDLYALDLSRSPPLMTEISEFARSMDECTCYDNIFMTITDFGGSTIEVWDMNLNWKLIKQYKPPLSRKEGQGICSIRFSSSGMYLGVTLTAPYIEKAYFQLRNWQDMTMLHTVEQPFYEGYCNHYMLALPNDEFMLYKYSEKDLFLFNSNGKRTETIRYNKRICSVALIVNDKNCLVIQSSRPDELYFYDI